jgi:hypothetical protein
MQAFSKMQSVISKHLGEAIQPVLDQMKDFAWAEQMQAVVRVQNAFGRQLNDVLRPLLDVNRAIENLVPTLDFTKFQEAWKRSLPPNWRATDASGLSSEPGSVC